MSNITQVVSNDKNMSTLNKGVLAANLDQVLSGTGPFTVFAPTDLAFGKLESGTIETLLKPESKAKLTDLLKHHVVAGQINYKDLKDGDKLKTLDGKELMISVKENNIYVDGAAIQDRDVKTSNGVIHSVSKVLSN
jgi:uncharacterized surface protein with fasciclin (FAS1) repeats